MNQPEAESGGRRAKVAGDSADPAGEELLKPTFDPQLCGASGPLESLSFEELLSALELVTGRLANGDLGIEAAADLYEQAELLHAAASGRLAAVEARIARSRRPAPE